MDKTPIYSAGNRVETPVYAHDVFKLSESGRAQIRSGQATTLPRDALALLVMLDGKRTVGDVEQSLSGLDPKALRQVLRSLLSANLVEEVSMAERGEVELDFGAFFAAAARANSSLGAETSAVEEAKKATPELDQKGYYVAIARQAVACVQGRRIDVLIVEDDPDVVSLVTRILPAARFHVASAANKAQALARLNQMPSPELIILDVHLPDLNGFDLLARLKAHRVLKPIPVVMLTADAEPRSIARGLMHGADGYITKPFDSAALLKGVDAVLGL